MGLYKYAPSKTAARVILVVVSAAYAIAVIALIAKIGL